MVKAMPGVNIIRVPMMAWLASVSSRWHPRMQTNVMSAAAEILRKPLESLRFSQSSR